jgi:hypothetical protein
MGDAQRPSSLSTWWKKKKKSLSLKKENSDPHAKGINKYLNMGITIRNICKRKEKRNNVWNLSSFLTLGLFDFLDFCYLMKESE